MSTPSPPRVLFDRVSKRFGDVVANNEISCDIAVGGIHAFLGENGAGKSTLMKILSGAYRPDTGRVLMDGVPTDFRSPADARRVGIGMVHQHLSLVSGMSVLDNITLGDERTPFFLRRQALAREVRTRAHHFGFDFDLMASVSDVSVSERQKLEVFKLLWRDARVLILDEPTSQLTPFEAEDVLRTMRRLASEGRTILLVSHNISEVVRFASRITVLAKGRCLKTFEADAVRMEELARLMVGDLAIPASRRSSRKTSDPVLSVRDVGVVASDIRRSLKEISFDVFQGEVLGVAGVANSGQEEITAILTGHLQPDSGSLLVNGVPGSWASLQIRSSCAAYVPADSRSEGSVAALSLLDNLFLRDVFRSDVVRGPFLRRSAMATQTMQRLSDFGVQPRDPALPSGDLSGGNLQRLVLARELSHDSSVLIAVNPTAGLDIAGTRNVLGRLRDHAATGRAVVVVSYDLQELLSTCDRLIVLSDGEIAGIDFSNALDSDAVGLLMGGVKADVVHAILGSSLSVKRASTELKTALRKLLTSENRWQRNIGAQVGLRVLDTTDVALIRARMADESYEDTWIWLSLFLARVVGGTEVAKMIEAFKSNPFGFVEVQRKIYGSPDHASLRDHIQKRLADHVDDWEVVLGLLTLDHLGVSFNDDVAAAIESSDVQALLSAVSMFRAKATGSRP